MAQTSLLPPPKQQFLDSNGDPLSGGKLYFYEPGTSTPKSVYSSSNGTTALANPVILDSAGRASVWLDGFYKVTLKDSSDVEIYTTDNVSSQFSDATVSYEYVLQNETPTYISGTQFSVPDDRTSHYEVGRRVQAVVTAGTIYGTVTASSAGGAPTITTITVLWDSGTLDAGLSAVSTGVLSVSNNAMPVQQVVTKSADYSMAVTDINKIVQLSSANSANITMLGASSVPDGAWNLFKNANAGSMVVEGTINGVANRTLYNNSALYVYSDGSAWHAPGEQLNLPPIGTVLAWHKSLTGVPATLPYGWIECNGQTLSDADSPLNGQVIPDMNGDSQFIRGSNVSGTIQANQNLEHTHVITVANDGAIKIAAGAANDFGGTNAVNQAYTADITATAANTGGTESRPDNISMTWIIRVK